MTGIWTSMSTTSYVPEMHICRATSPLPARSTLHPLAFRYDWISSTLSRGVFADSSGCSCGEATVERLVGQGFPRVESRLKPVQVLEQGRPHEAAHVDPIPLLAAGLRRRFRTRRRVR